jgi:hypothetical protein
MYSGGDKLSTFLERDAILFTAVNSKIFHHSSLLTQLLFSLEIDSASVI